MATMSNISNMQSPYGLADLQTRGGCFQCYESRIPSHRRTPGQLVDSSRNTYGVTALCVSYDKPRLWSVNLDHHHYRRGTSWKTQSGYRKINGLRGLRSSPSSGRVWPHKALNGEKTSRLTAEGTVKEQQEDGKSENNAENGEEGAGTSNGLSALDAYFNKLKGSAGDPANAAATPSVSVLFPLQTQKQYNAVTSNSGYNSSSAATDGAREELEGLKSLDAYFEKLNPKKKPEPERVQEEVKLVEKTPAELTDEELFMKSLIEAKEDYERYRSSRKDQGSSTESPGDLKFQVTTNSEMNFPDWELEEEQTGNSNLINVLVAINIGVYLFGLASPHEAMGITDSSLPIVYGAKVNELIMAGQWWRFITPMFLHASLLHIGLGSWALLSFGPAVESAYGTLGFSMIYFLGGLFGDLTSFFHTTEWTVGGTGPIYALVGTWVVYLLKNRAIIGKDIADDMIRKVVILSAVNVALCNSLPIDDWTHLGALLIGTVFGILAGPTMQLNVALKESSPDKEDEEAKAYLWFNDGASPVRLSLVFALCIGIFFILYQLSISGSNDFNLLEDMDDFS
ncbi:unnamed protein product [Calypogeia fissa]